jgi:lysozyme
MATSIIKPMVVDLSHHNIVNNLQAAKDWGIRGIIHKATERNNYVDPTYDARRVQAKAVGMLWGAYHFFRPGDVEEQVNWFLEHAKADEKTLLVLDHEDSACSAHDAEQFLRMVEERTKRKAALYSGNTIKEQLGNQVSAYLGSCRLWLAEYGSKPECQASWNDWWLWQYTGDGIGPHPQVVPGIGEGNDPHGPIDVNSFAGTLEELQNSWAGDPSIGVYDPRATEVYTWAQATLNILGTTPELVVDGRFGNKTREAIGKYQLDNELNITGLPDQPTIEDMCDEVQKWNNRRRK